jgi:hypothetical protein
LGIEDMRYKCSFLRSTNHDEYMVGCASLCPSSTA